MDLTRIGAYGPWAASLVSEKPGEYSFLNDRFCDVGEWRQEAMEQLQNRLAEPAIDVTPEVTVHRDGTHDGLQVTELSWQLPYGPATQAFFLKPKGADEPLPGVLALHDHGGRMYFGKRKIAQVNDDIHPVIVGHRREAYAGLAWANELAKRGYAVLVPDAFSFASRRVMLDDVPEVIRGGLSDDDPENVDNVDAYNNWSMSHESIVAKSLFCSGTTLPGVFLSEDRAALGVLAAIDGVDAKRLGCGGLSGGGLRTVFLGGTDPRIKCAVCVGMMSTWRDYLLTTGYMPTWMVYVPRLPGELEYAEILGLRMPLPTLVQNNNEDHLFTLPEMERADEILSGVYKKAGAKERYRCSFYPGHHKFDVPMQAEAFDWFDQWLNV